MCTICGISFQSKGGYRTHIFRKHPELKNKQIGRPKNTNEQNIEAHNKRQQYLKLYYTQNKEKFCSLKRNKSHLIFEGMSEFVTYKKAFLLDQQYMEKEFNLFKPFLQAFVHFMMASFIIKQKLGWKFYHCIINDASRPCPTFNHTNYFSFDISCKCFCNCINKIYEDYNLNNMEKEKVEDKINQLYLSPNLWHYHIIVGFNLASISRAEFTALKTNLFAGYSLVDWKNYGRMRAISTLSHLLHVFLYICSRTASNKLPCHFFQEMGFHLDPSLKTPSHKYVFQELLPVHYIKEDMTKCNQCIIYRNKAANCKLVLTQRKYLTCKNHRAFNYLLITARFNEKHELLTFE